MSGKCALDSEWAITFNDLRKPNTVFPQIIGPSAVRALDHSRVAEPEGLFLSSHGYCMKTNPAKNMPVRETSQFMREMWAAEAEHPVFAGSLFNLRCMIAGAANPRKRSTAKTS